MTRMDNSQLCPAVSLTVVAMGIFLVSTASAESEPDSTHALVKTGLLRTRSTHINGYPYAFYTPETQLAFGVGGIATFYTAKEAQLKPSKATLSGYYTTNDQYKISLGAAIFFARNRYLATGDLSYGLFVDKFWGIGNETPDAENAPYTTKIGAIFLNLQAPPIIGSSLSRKIGVIVDFNNTDIANKKSNPFLLADAVTGSNGGLSSGLGAVMSFDTRDQVFFPNRGGLYEFRAIFYMKAIGSDFDFNRYTVDLRHYLRLGHPDRVLAMQLYADFAAGNTPFFELPALGGAEIMRGYFTGRYRDENYLAGQIELRSYIWGRLGGVAFAGLGDVGRHDKPMSLDTVKYSLGFGLRFKFNQEEKVNLRADFGWGEGTSGVYFGLEEAF